MLHVHMLSFSRSGLVVLAGGSCAIGGFSFKFMLLGSWDIDFCVRRVQVLEFRLDFFFYVDGPKK